MRPTQPHRSPLEDRFDVRYMPGTNDFLVMDRGRPHHAGADILPNADAVTRYVKGTLSDERVARGLPSLFEPLAAATPATRDAA
jgi:hypothetical protein